MRGNAQNVLFLISGYGFLLSMVFFAIAIQAQAARRLVTLKDYPPLDEIPTHLKTTIPAKSSRKARARTKPGDGNAVQSVE
jgi:hypothetical protein